MMDLKNQKDQTQVSYNLINNIVDDVESFRDKSKRNNTVIQIDETPITHSSEGKRQIKNSNILKELE